MRISWPYFLKWIICLLHCGLAAICGVMFLLCLSYDENITAIFLKLDDSLTLCAGSNLWCNVCTYVLCDVQRKS